MKLALRVAAALLVLSVAGCRATDPSFKIDLIKFLDNSYTASFQENLEDGLQAAGLVKGRDYTLRSRSAQGDMSNLTLLVDSAASDHVNLLITFQSPTLYTAIQRAPKVPKIFTLLQNPFILGAGKSDADHLPNLTGMYLVPPFDDLTTAASESTPPLSVLGTVFFAGSEDSVYRKDELVRIAREKHIEVIAEPYSSSDEIPAAIDILLSKNPKGVVHLQDPAQDVTFPVLYQRASSRKIPVLSVVYNMEKLGASLVYTTDREAVGKQFATMVGRIIKGTDPTSMPFENDRDLPKRVGYSRTAADAAGLVLPASIIGQATSSN